MSSRPYYRWFPGDWKADTQLLTLEEKGAYRELLDALWVHGPLPDSDQVRGKLLGSYARTTARLWTKLSPFFQISDGHFDHPKIAEQRAQALEIARERQKAGAKGGKAAAQAKAIAKATQARVRRARPDPDKDQTPALPALDRSATSLARTREAGDPDGANGNGLDRNQRAEAERLQAELEKRRQAEGIGDGQARPAGAIATGLTPGQSESESGD